MVATITQSKLHPLLHCHITLHVKTKGGFNCTITTTILTFFFTLFCEHLYSLISEGSKQCIFSLLYMLGDLCSSAQKRGKKKGGLVKGNAQRSNEMAKVCFLVHRGFVTVHAHCGSCVVGKGRRRLPKLTTWKACSKSQIHSPVKYCIAQNDLIFYLT